MKECKRDHLTKNVVLQKYNWFRGRLSVDIKIRSDSKGTGKSQRLRDYSWTDNRLNRKRGKFPSEWKVLSGILLKKRANLCLPHHE